MKVLLDPISLTVTCPSEILLKDLNLWLKTRDLILPYHPTSQKLRTLLEALEKATPNRLSLRYGEIGDLCLSLTVKTPQGTFRTKKVPKSATGPDLKRIFIGSRRRYGRILGATLRVIPKPQTASSVTIAWGKRAGRKTFLRALSGSGVRAVSIHELSPKGLRIRLEGTPGMVTAEQRTVRRLARLTDGVIR